MHFFSKKGHALYMYKDDLEWLKIYLYFSRIFSKIGLAMDAETCVEASSGLVDSSLHKSWSPWVGWGHKWGNILTKDEIEKNL